MLLGKWVAAVHSYQHEAAAPPLWERSAGVHLAAKHSLNVLPRHHARLPCLNFVVGIEPDGRGRSHVAKVIPRGGKKQDAGS